MQKTKNTVLLIFGGRGAEHDVSKMSAEYLFTLLDREAFEVIPIFITREGRWLKLDTPKISGEHDTEDLREVHLGQRQGVGGITEGNKFTRVDAAFPILHGDFGEDGVVQGALENAKIKFVGSDNYSGPITMDKAFTKIIAERLGIPTARFVLGIDGAQSYSKEETLNRAERLFGYPMFIKPSRLGSSIGAGRACGREEASALYDKALEYSPRVLIEELVDIDKEVECAYFKVKNKEIITDLAEISCSFGFYDYDKKYLGQSGASLSPTADTSRRIREAVKGYTKLLAEYIGVRHLGRFDFFITRDGRILFNEINAIPGVTVGSLYPALLEKSGITAADAVNLMIKDALRLI